MGPRAICGTRIAAFLAVLLLAVAYAPAARADGDPASDILVTNQVFLTSLPATVSAAQRQLVAVVREANRAGFTIRVAVISTDYDLGSITALWQKPEIYARFLGLELAPGYEGRLLVVMPNGFGLNWPGHSVAAEDRQLASVPVDGTPDGLADATQTAVRRLAGSAGLTLTPVGRASGAGSPRSGGIGTAVVIGAALGAVAFAAALGLGVRRAPERRRERRRGLRSPERRRERPRGLRSPDRRRDLPVRVRWTIPAVALLCAVAVAAPILALRRGGVSNSEIATVITPPPFSWPAGRRPAPDFALRDQNGRPASIAAYRGRPVVVTFIDPLCRNLCPLEAQVLNQTEQQMPASQRPAIVAVSVDVYADSRADLRQDVREWHLAPQWRWAVGRPTQLAAVWRQYEIGVSVVTKRIAGAKIHYVTHTEGAYIIDATGHERALFLWPFYPQDVERVLRQLA